MPLFEVAIVKQPTRKELEEGTGTEELVFFTDRPVVAKNKETAAIAALIGPNAPTGLDLNRCEVSVRPFA